MVDVYYTVHVEPSANKPAGQWRLAVTECVSAGSSLSKHRLYFERFFDSQEAAVAYGSAWASLQRNEVIHAGAMSGDTFAGDAPGARHTSR
jgi:hypothetical protein